MRLGTADVLVVAKTDKFNKDIDKSEKKIKGFAGQSSKALGGLSKSFVSLAGPAGVAAFTASLIGGYTPIIFLFVNSNIIVGVFDPITIISGLNLFSSNSIEFFIIFSNCFFVLFPYGKFFLSAK